MKIIHEKNKCIGCGTCVALCPEFWEMGEDGKAHLIDSKTVGEDEELEIDDKKIGCHQEAADSCPVQCIHLKKVSLIKRARKTI